MKYKMIVSDFDGTFIKDDFTYSKQLAEAVKKYTARGGKFMFATGRMTCSILPYCEQLGLKGEVVTYQGSAIEDIQTREKIATCLIDWQDALKAAEWIEAHSLYYQLYDFDKFIIQEVTPYTDVYTSYSCFAPQVLGYPISEYIRANKFCPIKMMIMVDPEKVNGIIKEMDKQFGDVLLFNSSLKFVVEMVNNKVNKGSAVEMVAQRHNIAREEVICIGDASNDIAMIKYAGLGVVVANGSDEIKCYADEIAPSNNEQGVLYIINKYGLQE